MHHERGELSKIINFFPLQISNDSESEIKSHPTFLTIDLSHCPLSNQYLLFELSLTFLKLQEDYQSAQFSVTHFIRKRKQCFVVANRQFAKYSNPLVKIRFENKRFEQGLQ